MTVKQLIELLQKHHSDRMDCPIAMLNKDVERGKSLDEQVRQISKDVGFIPSENSGEELVLLEEKDPSEDLHYGRSHPLHTKWKTKVKQWRKHSGISGMNILVVEDNEDRIRWFEHQMKKPLHSDNNFRIVWAKSAGSAIGLLNRDKGSVYAGIMLDYDLTDQSMTMNDGHFNGMNVVMSIIKNVDKDVPIFVHSSNSIYGPKMKLMLLAAGYAVDRMPFSYLTETALSEWLDYVAAVRTDMMED